MKNIIIATIVDIVLLILLTSLFVFIFQTILRNEIRKNDCLPCNRTMHIAALYTSVGEKVDMDLLNDAWNISN